MHKYVNYRCSRRRREKKGYEKIFQEIIVENFPKHEKEIVCQVQGAQRVSYRISSRRNTPTFELKGSQKKIKRKDKRKFFKRL